MRIGISNSEVNSFNACETAWLKQYHPESLLARKSAGPARTRGIILHSCLEIYYRMLKDEQSISDAVDAAMEILMIERKKASEMYDADKMEMLRRATVIMKSYFEYYKDDVKNWEIISTENFHAMEAISGDDFYVPMRLDMVIYQRSGKFAGEISPVDHKSTNDWWSPVMFTLNSQLPLYIRALRENGFKGHLNPVVRRGIFNFIRTRDIRDPYPSELFRREFISPSPARVENTYQNHLRIARRIARLKKMTYAEAVELVSMNLSTNSCKYCDFKQICEVEIDGDDPRYTIMADYERNTYGYVPLEELDAGI